MGLLICLCLFLTFACRKRGTALLEQAQLAWDNGDYMTAAARYEDFFKDSPPAELAAAARFKLANIYLYNLKQYEMAIQHYIHLIEDFPKSPDVIQARQRLAESYSAAKKPREAIMEYENLLQAVPDFPDKRRIRLSVADLYYDLNELGQALAEYQKLIVNMQYDELSERANLRIGGIHVLRDEFDEAIPAYQIVAASTQDGEVRRFAQYGLADCFERTFNYDGAVKVLEGMDPDPKNPEYIQRRINSIRELERQRNLTVPTGAFRSHK